MEFHRFSPYQMQPRDFGLTLRPAQKYGFLYPFTEETVSQIAYVFERADSDQLDMSYLLPFLKQIGRWHAAFKEDECPLIWWPDGNDIVVRDDRSTFPPATYRLTGYASVVFKQLDKPTALPGLMRQARAASSGDSVAGLLATLFATGEPRPASTDHVIGFSASQFVESPDETLRPLVEAGLVYVEPAISADPWFLALPVASTWSPAQAAWIRSGV